MKELLERLMAVAESDSYWADIRKRGLASYRSENAVAYDENETYRVELHPDGMHYYILKRMPDKPVVAGRWLGFWDPDLEEVLGITKKQYNLMSTMEQKRADVSVQLKKYVDIEFWSMYAEQYFPEEFEKRGRSGSLEDLNKYWKNKLSGVRETYETVDGLDTWTNEPSKFVGSDYLPEDVEPGLYHVTTAKTKVKAQGLKPRSVTKSVGLGGGYKDEDPGLISVTFDESHAMTIADRLKMAIKAAKGLVSKSDVIDYIAQEYDLESWEMAEALGAPAKTYSDYDDPAAFDAWVDENYDDAYTLLQELDDALQKVFTEAETMGYRVGLTASKEAMARLNPNEVEVLSIEARVGAKPKHIHDEAELRFRPEDIRVAKERR